MITKRTPVLILNFLFLVPNKVPPITTLNEQVHCSALSHLIVHKDCCAKRVKAIPNTFAINLTVYIKEIGLHVISIHKRLPIKVA